MTLLTYMMKFTAVCIISALASYALAFDPTVLGARAVNNLNLTPSCAQRCIFNPKYAKIYAPECKDLGFGVEYATRLCKSYLYQHMLDGCFKEKCCNDDRKRVTMLARDLCTLTLGT